MVVLLLPPGTVRLLQQGPDSCIAEQWRMYVHHIVHKPQDQQLCRVYDCCCRVLLLQSVQARVHQGSQAVVVNHDQTAHVAFSAAQGVGCFVCFTGMPLLLLRSLYKPVLHPCLTEWQTTCHHLFGTHTIMDIAR